MRVTGNEIVMKNNVTHSWQHLRTVARQRNTLLCLSCNNLWKKLQQHLRTVAATSDNSCCNTEQLQGKITQNSCRAKEHITVAGQKNTEHIAGQGTHCCLGWACADSQVSTQCPQKTQLAHSSLSLLFLIPPSRHRQHHFQQKSFSIYPCSSTNDN